jgi:hypothetical protein
MCKGLRAKADTMVTFFEAPEENMVVKKGLSEKVQKK